MGIGITQLTHKSNSYLFTGPKFEKNFEPKNQNTSQEISIKTSKTKPTNDAPETNKQ